MIDVEHSFNKGISVFSNEKFELLDTLFMAGSISPIMSEILNITALGQNYLTFTPNILQSSLMSLMIRA